MFPEWLKRDGMPVKITGYNATTKAHDWTLQIIEPDGTFTDDTRAISGSGLFEMNEQRVPDGTYIFARWAGLDSAGMSVWMCAAGGNAGSLQPATLTQVGGDAGSPTSACTFTYTATLKDGTPVITTAVQPEVPRLLVAPHTAATLGEVYQDADGVWRLWKAHETLAQVNCEEAT